MENPAPGTDARASETIAVDFALFAPINGVDQWVTIRGRDLAHPVLLILSGPNVAFSRWRPLFEPWERDFTLVQWDQPGAEDARRGALSLERLVNDAVAVIEFVRDRLGAAQVVVLGISGGSVVGLMLARRRPDLLSAYVGSGQFVDYARQDALSYAAVLDRARAAGDAAVVNELESLGPPPWPNAESDAVVSKHSGALTQGERAAFTPELMAAISRLPTGAPQAEADPRAAAMAVYGALRDELKAFRARDLGTRFEMPMLFIQGDQDLYSVTSEVAAYAAEIDAPRRAMAVIEGGGHSCFMLTEAFGARLHDLLKNSRPD